MTALADDRSLDQLNAAVPPIIQGALEANAVVYTGSACAPEAGSSGYVAASDATDTGTNPVVGVANHAVDNTGGSNGDKSVNMSQGTFRRVNSGSDAVDQSHMNQIVYAEDDQTVAATDGSSTLGILGYLVGFEDDGTPLVFIHGPTNLALST